MTQFTNPLNNIRIASPCSADWDAMIGTNRQRYCGDCKLNVYNLSGMSSREAEDLLIRSEGRLCVRFYKRADGTMLTKDCPVGWQAFKKRASRYWTAAFSLLFGLFAGLGLNAFFGYTGVTNEPTMGVMAEQIDPPQHQLMGKPVIPEEQGEVIMGDIESYPLGGAVSNIEDVRRQVLENQK